MKTIERTPKKIVIEATKTEIGQKGFDVLWDDVREIYPASLYDVDGFESKNDGKIFTIQLKLKKT